MDQALRRTTLLLTLLVAAACGGDDSDDKNERTDATMTGAGGPKETPPDTKDAGRDSGKDAAPTAPNMTGTAGWAGGKPAAASCDDIECKEPATCEVEDGKARCVCPDGYDDPKGDGSQCQDKNECDAENDCGRNAKCENKPGGYECKCQGAYKGDGKGKACECADGYEAQDNACVGTEGKSCEDNIDCAKRHCVGGICCAQACDSPEAECLTVEGATCADGKTCKYPVAKDGADCDDADACTLGSKCQAGKCQKGTEPKVCDDKNPCTDDSCDTVIGCKTVNNTAACDDGDKCTQNDTCKNGSCSVHTLHDCSTENDACNLGACKPEDGSCIKKPKADGLACNDANSCTTTDTCMAGVCGGASDACGPNATACTAGTPNTCTCKETFRESNGKCVPDMDECAAATAPCSPNADCFDPSNSANDVQCTCKADYTGDGKTCVAKNPCMNNPCGEGRGTCTNGVAGQYTCACNAGFTAIAGKCACNLGGTFAVRTRLDLSWADQDTIEGGSDTQYGWTIQRLNYDVDGNVAVEVIPCGETNIDLCGQGVRIAGVPEEAYAQYVPIAIWGKAGSPSTQYSFMLTDALPGSKYLTPEVAVLQGIQLNNPLGEWPSKRQDIEGADGYDGSATNGARWIDADNDGVFGLTTYTVGPNGVAADGSATAPISAYDTRSKVCPRSDPSAERSPYNYPPGAEGLTVRRIKRFFSANRVTSSYDGRIDSCDLLAGEVRGPAEGRVRFDTRIGGCLRANGSAESQCSGSLLDFLDMTGAPNKVEANSFIMKRVEDTATCETVRALSY